MLHHTSQFPKKHLKITVITVFCELLWYHTSRKSFFSMFFCHWRKRSLWGCFAF